MYLDENSHLGSGTPSIMDSPTLARVERAMQRQEGKNIFCCQTTTLPGHAIQRGLLWQQRDKLFARWKERYFILTRDYLHCFRKATDNGLDRISDMGPFIFKIKLVEVERVTWINKKTYSAIALDFGREGRILLRSQHGLEDWFDSLEECTIASKERRRALKCSRDSYQGENEQNMNSMNSNVEEWLAARKKIAQLQRDYISDSVPDISKLDPPSLRNSIAAESRSGDEDDRWYNGTFNAANQRLSLLTDIDINALDTSPPSLRGVTATPTPCRLNSDVFFLPGLSGVRQRSSIAGGAVQTKKANHHDYMRPRLGTDASEVKSRNLLGSFRVPNMLQTTRGTANRDGYRRNSDLGFGKTGLKLSKSYYFSLKNYATASQNKINSIAKALFNRRSLVYSASQDLLTDVLKYN